MFLGCLIELEKKEVPHSTSTFKPLLTKSKTQLIVYTSLPYLLLIPLYVSNHCAFLRCIPDLQWLQNYSIV